MKLLFGLGVVALGLLAGCAARPFPVDLFTVDGANADYPIMLSRTSGGRGGRPVQAQSGTHTAASSYTYSTGKTTVTVTQVQESESEMPASAKLLAQVQRKDRWLALDAVVFEATDYTTYGSASTDRVMQLRGTVQR
jgi:hypothetical protein